MAIKQVKVSDLSGADGADIGAVIKDHPSVEGSKVLDVTEEEAEGFKAKALTNLVTVELRYQGYEREIVLKQTDFDKLVSQDILTNARGTKGRQPGYSPRANGG